MVAQALWEITRLWTGHAEEGLEGLSEAINYFRAESFQTESLRPITARLYLERSYYYATHQHPTEALADLKAGIILCSYPEHCKLGEKIKEELAWRYSESNDNA